MYYLYIYHIHLMVYSAYFKGITMSSTFMENLNVVFEYRIPERYFFCLTLWNYCTGFMKMMTKNFKDRTKKCIFSRWNQSIVWQWQIYRWTSQFLLILFFPYLYQFYPLIMPERFAFYIIFCICLTPVINSKHQGGKWDF